MDSNATFKDSLSTLLIEVFDGPPGRDCLILNPKDPGLVRQMESISAEMASMRPMPGQTTIAAHVDHVLYGLSLLNRWAAGEENPWATADWTASWKRTKVNDAEWKDLCARLRKATADWKQAVERRTDWIPLTACGAIASCAHAAYHLGAIRQILAAMNANSAPG